MKKYTVTASYVMYCTAEIEADNQEEAFAIAKSMDGGEFQPDTYGGSDWEICEVREVNQ